MIEPLLPVRPESPVLQARITPPPSACQRGLGCLHSNRDGTTLGASLTIV